MQISLYDELFLHYFICAQQIPVRIDFKTIKNILFCRYGLYGAPLEPTLFDMEPPHLNRIAANSIQPTTYATLITNNNPPPTAAQSSYGSPTSQDEPDLRDLLLTSDKWNHTGRTQSSSSVQNANRHVFGLLEVEPLHFTCHATSDGTRIERMDTGMHNLSFYFWPINSKNAVNQCI